VRHAVEWIAGATIPEGDISAHRPSAHSPPTGEMDQRDPDPSEGWLGRPEVDPEQLAGVPLFASLGPVELGLVAKAGVERAALPGESIIRQWDSSRDFFVLLEGIAEVRTESGLRRAVEAGDFFGEVAALDWGAGYGYPRLASVVAKTHCRLLVIPWVRFGPLMQNVPEVAQRVRTALQERLPTL
jgi:signal-transduction protein with cAMP-binding, CBS, and nucleotidyltransferase domain